MKGFLSKIGGKLATVADDIASYNTTDLSGPAGSTKLKGPAVTPAQQQVNSSDPVLEHLIRNVRSNNVRRHFFHALKTSPSTYIQKKDVRVLASSYNTNGKKPPAGLDVGAWLGLWAGDWPPGANDVAEDAKDLPDIVCVGFQEIVPLNAGNVMIGSATHNLQAWDRAIAKYLNGEAWALQEFGPLGSDGGIQKDAPSAVINNMDQNWAGSQQVLQQQQQGSENGNAQSSRGIASTAVLEVTSGTPHVPPAFKQVACKQLVGTYISVWVRTTLLPHVRGVQATHVATGFGGYLGNKGGVVVRMQVYDSPLVLINTHLSAGSQDGDEIKRNSDAAEVLRRTDFSINGEGPTAMASPTATLVSATLGAGHWGSMKGITDHGNAIWMGDLNYRISPSVMPDEEVRKNLRAGRLQPLLDADQLCREMAAGRVFEGWREGPIMFEPTFKFKVGTHYYLGEPLPPTASAKSVTGEVVDSSEAGGDDDEEENGGGAGGSEKQRKRTPAWCDRVLWLPVRGELHQLAYGRSEITASDHKPVCAAFLWQARHYDRRSLEQALDDARRAADREASAARPRCTLDPIQIECATSGPALRYGEARTFPVRIKNTGPVPGLYHFVPPPSGLGLDDEGPALPPWLSASPPEGMVPANGTIDVDITFRVEGGACISSVLAEEEQLVSKQATYTPNQATFSELFKIVILRVEDGGDLFLTLQGRYAGSILGMPLAKLAALGPAPAARDTQGPACLELVAATGAASEALAQQGPLYSLLVGLGVARGEVSQLVPKELLHLSAWLTERPDRVASAGLMGSSASLVLGTQEVANLPTVASHGANPPSSDISGSAPAAGDAALWTDRGRVRSLLQKLAPLREVLDRGQLMPEEGCAGFTGVTPHVVASLLLAVFAELPQPLIPLTLASACDTKVPPFNHTLSILAASLNRHELACLNHLLAVATAVTAAQPKEVAGIAATLAAVLMPPIMGQAGASQEGANQRAVMIQELVLPPLIA